MIVKLLCKHLVFTGDIQISNLLLPRELSACTRNPQGALAWMWSFCSFMWGPLLISWLPDSASRLKDLGIFNNSSLCPLTKIGQVTKTFNISVVHLAKAVCYGFLVHFLTMLHFLCCPCGLVDANVTAEFYGRWSNKSMEKDWSNPSFPFHYTSIWVSVCYLHWVSVCFLIWTIGVL